MAPKSKGATATAADPARAQQDAALQAEADRLKKRALALGVRLVLQWCIGAAELQRSAGTIPDVALAVVHCVPTAANG